jgi:hypothetical protein
MDRPFEPVTGLFQGLAVREGQVDQRRWFLQHKLCYAAGPVNRRYLREDDPSTSMRRRSPR